MSAEIVEERLELVRALVAGDGSPTWAGIRIALEEVGIEVCGQAQSVQEVIDEATRLRPEVCLVDLGLTGGGLRAAAELAVHAPEAAVIIFSENLEEEEFLHAMRVGAVGYVATSISSDRLRAVVLSVLAGKPAIPRAFIPLLIERLRKQNGRRHLLLPQRRGVELTAREWEVLDLLRANLSTRQIADRLLISDVTVRRHIGTALKKLQVDSRREALKLLQSG